MNLPIWSCHFQTAAFALCPSMSLCVILLRVGSQFCIALWVCWISKPVILGVVSPVQVPRVGIPDVVYELLAPQGEVPYSWDPFWLWVAVTELFLMSLGLLPLLPMFMWMTYPLLWRSFASSVQVILRGNCSICSNRFVVTGRELRIFLCCHLEQPPVVVNITSFVLLN